jgi:hypothetical protein
MPLPEGIKAKDFEICSLRHRHSLRRVQEAVPPRSGLALPVRARRPPARTCRCFSADLPTSTGIYTGTLSQLFVHSILPFHHALSSSHPNPSPSLAPAPTANLAQAADSLESQASVSDAPKPPSAAVHDATSHRPILPARVPFAVSACARRPQRIRERFLWLIFAHHSTPCCSPALPLFLTRPAENSVQSPSPPFCLGDTVCGLSHFVDHLTISDCYMRWASTLSER